MAPSDSENPRHRFRRLTPEGDTQARMVCNSCGFVDYKNPKIVVGVTASWEGRLLLCRRAIPPRNGYWTLPAGYLELGETAIEGAKREAWEEARARVDIDQLMAVYAIPRISQIQLIYRARLTDPKVEAGEETSELALFEWDRIPWADLAFPSVHWALNHHHEIKDKAGFVPFSNPAGELGDYSP